MTNKGMHASWWWDSNAIRAVRFGVKRGGGVEERRGARWGGGGLKTRGHTTRAPPSVQTQPVIR